MNDFRWGDLGGAFVFAVVVLALVFLVRWAVLNFTSEGHWVYEIDTEDGSLLYIGECSDVAKRMKRHVQYQSKLPPGHPRRWWWDADPAVQANMWPSRVTWYRSKEIAKAIEKQRVRTKNPIANQIRYKGVISGGD
jgi:hypothetical protein